MVIEIQNLSSEMSFSNLNMHFIYYIKNKKNSYTYIGMTYNPNKRFSQHLSALQENVHINKKLQRDYNFYGQDNFSAGILEILPSKEKAVDREKVIIRNLFKENELYNEVLYIKHSNEVLYIKHNKEKDLNDPAVLRSFILEQIGAGKSNKEIRETVLSLGIASRKLNNAFNKLECIPEYDEDETTVMQKFNLYYHHSEQEELGGCGVIDRYGELIDERRDGFFYPDRKKFIAGIEELIKDLTFSNKQLSRLEKKLNKKG